MTKYICIFLVLFLLNCQMRQVQNNGKTRSFILNYQLTVKDINPDNDSDIKIWVPIPQDTEYQYIKQINID